MKSDLARRTRVFYPLAVATLLLASSGFGNEETRDAVFQYAGGTERIEIDCAGKLEVTLQGLVFKCPSGSVEMPFSTITLMQFRPDVSRRVRTLKLKWSTFPSNLLPGKQNKYFTVVCRKQGVTHVVVLSVDPLSMRPYLAEIELKSGKRVEVMPYEDYS
jgi:hypothetical protein